MAQLQIIGYPKSLFQHFLFRKVVQQGVGAVEMAEDVYNISDMVTEMLEKFGKGAN